MLPVQLLRREERARAHNLHAHVKVDELTAGLDWVRLLMEFRFCHQGTEQWRWAHTGIHSLPRSPDEKCFFTITFYLSIVHRVSGSRCLLARGFLLHLWIIVATRFRSPKISSADSSSWSFHSTRSPSRARCASLPACVAAMRRAEYRCSALFGSR